MQKVRITKEDDPWFNLTGLAEVSTDGVAVYKDGNPKFRVFYFNEIKVIDKASVYDATHLVFNQQREFFPVMDLIRAVRRMTGREYLMDGTILRRLRELREDSKINYEVIDTQKAKYKKLKS